LAALLFTRRLFSGVRRSGLVVAGFGEDEVFPSLRSFHLETIVNNRLKYVLIQETDITHDMTASITPFAQSEMAETFVEGVDPRYAKHAEGHLDRLFSGLPGAIVGNIPGLTPVEQATILPHLKSAIKKLLDDFKKRMKAFQRQAYIDSTLDVVSVLPTDDLAVMAETLVSLRRKSVLRRGFGAEVVWRGGEDGG
jgi:hypothetical protein